MCDFNLIYSFISSALIVLANLLFLIIHIIIKIDDCNAAKNTTTREKELDNNHYFCTARLGMAGSFIFNFSKLKYIELV